MQTHRKGKKVRSAVIAMLAAHGARPFALETDADFALREHACEQDEAGDATHEPAITMLLDGREQDPAVERREES